MLADGVAGMSDVEAIRKCHELDNRHNRVLHGYSNPGDAAAIARDLGDFWLNEITEEQAQMLLNEIEP